MHVCVLGSEVGLGRLHILCSTTHLVWYSSHCLYEYSTSMVWNYCFLLRIRTVWSTLVLKRRSPPYHFCINTDFVPNPMPSAAPHAHKTCMHECHLELRKKKILTQILIDTWRKDRHLWHHEQGQWRGSLRIGSPQLRGARHLYLRDTSTWVWVDNSGEKEDDDNRVGDARVPDEIVLEQAIEGTGYL